MIHYEIGTALSVVEPSATSLASLYLVHSMHTPNWNSADSPGSGRVADGQFKFSQIRYKAHWAIFSQFLVPEPGEAVDREFWA